MLIGKKAMGLWAGGLLIGALSLAGHHDVPPATNNKPVTNSPMTTPATVKPTEQYPRPRPVPATDPADELVRFKRNPPSSVIPEDCATKWLKDFSMRAYCEKNQWKAVDELHNSTGAPMDINPDVFKMVRAECATKWPRDFDMRVYCEKNQWKAVRQLRENHRH